MNYKKIAGLFVLIAGIVLLSYGFYGKSEMDEAREDIDSSTGFIPDNPLKDVVTGKLHGEVDKYRLPVALCFIGGIALIIVGGSVLYYFRKEQWIEKK